MQFSSDCMSRRVLYVQVEPKRISCAWKSICSGVPFAEFDLRSRISVCCLPRGSPEHNDGDNSSTRRKANTNRREMVSKNRARTSDKHDRRVCVILRKGHPSTSRSQRQSEAAPSLPLRSLVNSVLSFASKCTLNHLYRKPGKRSNEGF